MTETCTDIFAIRGRDWQASGPRRKERLVERAFNLWRERGFPHFSLNSLEIKNEYYTLLNRPFARIQESGIAGSNTGLRLANFFQPQMWSVRVSRYLSPADVFWSDSMLPMAIRRSWSIWPDRFGANPATLRRILKTYPGTASVSNFRPTVAQAVLDSFSSTNSKVLDFSAGYGGRMLGALTRKRFYLGIEPCAAQLAGLTKMHMCVKEFASTASVEILQGCAEDVMPQLGRCTIDLVFSSPPYFDWEKYAQEPTQSFVRYATYEEWKAGFLERTLFHSARVLRKDGFLVLNVSSGRRNPSPADVIAIAKMIGLTYVKSIPLLISRVPYLHPRTDSPQKREALLIFRK